MLADSYEPSDNGQFKVAAVIKQDNSISASVFSFDDFQIHQYIKMKAFTAFTMYYMQYISISLEKQYFQCTSPDHYLCYGLKIFAGYSRCIINNDTLVTHI